MCGNEVRLCCHFDSLGFRFLVADNVDASEAKGLFEANFSHIYHILYDSFIQAETNLRQRGENMVLKKIN